MPSSFVSGFASGLPSRHSRREGAAHAGQSLIEFALTLPVLLMFLLSTVNVVQIVMANYTVAQAARIAANEAAISGGDLVRARTAAYYVLDSGIGTSTVLDPGSGRQLSFQLRCARTPCQRYDAITVDIVYQDRVWAPILWWGAFQAQASSVRASEIDNQ